MTMKLHVKQEEITLLIMDYMKRNEYYESLRALERESGMNLDKFGREIDYLRSLCLDGEWDDAENFLKPLAKHVDIDFQAILFQIRRQKFLELLYGQRLSPAVVELVDHLKELEEKCPKIEFNKLCYCLTLKHLNDHPDFKSWTPFKGRIECFEMIRRAIDHIYGGNHHSLRTSDDMDPNRLIIALKQSLLYQLSILRSSNPHIQLPSTLTLTILHDVNHSHIPHSNVDDDDADASRSTTNVDNLKQEQQRERMKSWEIPLSTKNDKEIRDTISDDDDDDDDGEGVRMDFQCVGVYNNESAALRCCTYSPCGEYIAIGSNSSQLTILSSNQQLIPLYNLPNHHRASIYSVDWITNETNHLIATCSNDRMVKLVSLSKSSIPPSTSSNNVIEFSGHCGTVRQVAFRGSSSSQLLSAGEGDYVIRIYDASQRQTNVSFMSLSKHTRGIYGLCTSMSGDTAFSCAMDRTINVWDLHTGRSIKTISSSSSSSQSAPLSIACDSNVRQLVVGYSDGSCVGWDIGTSLPIWTTIDKLNHESDCRSIDLSPDNELVLSASYDGSIALCDARYGELLARYDGEHGRDKITCAQWHPLEPCFVSTGVDHTLRLWKCNS